MRKFTLSLAAAMLFSTASMAADTKLKMATIAPNLSAAITMATFANVVTNNLDDIEIEVAGGGAATLHMMEVGRGNLDMSMTNPVVFGLMKNGKAMYAKQPEAPALSENLNLLMLYPYGQYHFAVRADSDIKVLDDIEGASVFLGPQGGGAYNAARGWIQSTTGLAVGEDYEAIKANWQTGYQAFLDGKIDVYVNGCIDPCGQFIQFTETEDIRFLGPESHEGAAVDKFLGKFRYRDEIPAGMYSGQKNDGPVMSMNVAVGIGIRADMDEDTVYRITKTFWDNLDQITSDAPWAKALDVAYAVKNIGSMTIHPGAARYYREVGVLN
ncbi:MAG: TAXI family TRAP transporter solute-binding subunit [Candidatus Puniceispirillaceae bacterium]